MNIIYITHGSPLWFLFYLLEGYLGKLFFLWKLQLSIRGNLLDLYIYHTGKCPFPPGVIEWQPLLWNLSSWLLLQLALFYTFQYLENRELFLLLLCYQENIIWSFLNILPVSWHLWLYLIINNKTKWVIKRTWGFHLLMKVKPLAVIFFPVL